jgi:SAM-dependent methyltransferase
MENKNFTTDPQLVRGWDKKYEHHPERIPDWERLPLDDLEKFIEYCEIDTSKIRSIFEVGCGTGLRALLMMIGLPGFNRPEVKYRGIDLSAHAIERAKAHLEELRAARVPKPLQKYLGEGPWLPPRFQAEFQVGDLLTLPPPPAGEGYDLVVDWMCFHEVHIPNRNAHIARVTALCSRFVALKVFSEEGKKRVINLGDVFEGARKLRLKRSELTQLYGDAFSILNTHPYAEEEHPIPPHEDGAVAAKMAYLMVKKQ